MTTEQEPSSPLQNSPRANSPAQNHAATSQAYDQTQEAETDTETEIALNIDTSRLHQTHANAGYRDGITTAKAASAQSGFDEGYALGAELALAVGDVLGALAALTTGANTGGGSALAVLCARAEAELGAEGVFAGRYFGSDGGWLWDDEGEGEGLARVAGGHPAVGRWRGVVERLRGEGSLLPS